MKRDRVLIVDSDDKAGFLISKIMKRKGFLVEILSDGEREWEKIDRKKYSLVFLKGMNSKNVSFEIIKRLKKENKNVPIIILADPHNIKTATQAVKFGAFNYLVKPFDEEDVEIIAEKAITVKNLSAELAVLKKKLQEIDQLSGGFVPDTPKPVLNGEVSLEEAINPKLRDFFDNMNGLKLEGLHSIVLQTVEKLLITLTLGKTHGNQAKASKILGINRNTLRKKIASLEISIEK